MRISFDQNKLLSIQNENIPQTKEYTYTTGGYTFSDFDKGMIVLHKKDFKITNLKNLGDGMNVVFCTKENNDNIIFQQEIFEDALRLFNGFDEETGQRYFFIPGLGEKDMQEKNDLLKHFSKCEIKKTSKGAMVELQHAKEDRTNEKPQIEDILSYLFGLTLIYGKFDAKKGELASIKIQIPLFGQYLAQQEMLDKIINELQESSIFLKVDKLTNKNGITYQISSNDYELLEIFAKWYEPIEKFEKITKSVFTQDMKIKLIDFLEKNTEIPSDGKSEVLNQIKNGTIKFLMK
ncbi:MAG: hypothetical protein NTX91_01575 [candidate division SR1 bacterium]|nr:hypothetical protein [candidate division SR1 bacterium]